MSIAFTNSNDSGKIEDVSILQPLPVQQVGRYSNVAGAATTAVVTGKGVLQRIVVNKAVANGVITVYDNTAASGTKIGTITHPATLLASQYVQEFGVRFTTGLTVVTSAADDITIVYQQ